ncbi:cytochrome-c oxidase, cbb3-type subunit III [Belnapia sp. T6]|uniref:Cbb3-type cytochrome c oxidase subunit n=1 Tax=Belnapia mucosa TaxID=2804532 RepID=A0ABS1V788_9PROT|nr:cytochrome-c oxidase, cbb3-type subunit III [Belnapia mucosa]MBL6457520.1 cytochrome-c oxidase, cbb3-type subunit III [Belnapia mucosa]
MARKPETDAATGVATTGHEWDGIRELDTPMPSWWLYTFYATIAFALAWVVLYPALPFVRGVLGADTRRQLAETMATERAKAEPILARLRAATPEAIAADPELRTHALAGGRIAFATSCAGCHGAGGQGAPGGFPSLADDDWIYGGSFDDIRTTISHGVRNGEDAEARGTAMPAFAQAGLTMAQIGDVAEHVLSLSGTGPANAAGATLFAENCAACHGDRGEGNRQVGAPRLDDRIWLYGGDKASVTRTIAYSRAGVMPAWQGRLDPAVINMLTVYVHALGGGEQ